MLIKKEVVRAETILNQQRKVHCWTSTNKLLRQGYIGKTGFTQYRTYGFAAIKMHQGSPLFVCALGCSS